MEPEGSLLCSHKTATGLSWASWIQFVPYLPKVHVNVILPPTPRSSQWSLDFGPPNQPEYGLNVI
jgi:hypothetical protein